MASHTPAVPTQWLGVSSKGRIYEVLSVVFVGVAFITVVLRLIARSTSLRKLLPDDYFCILAQITTFGLMIVAILLAEKGAMGYHIQYIPPDQVVYFFKVFFAGELLYALSVYLYKLAVIFLYRNIFGEVKYFKITSWIMVALTTAWTLAAVFATIFQCSPVDKAWDSLLPGTCFDQEAYILGFGVSNLIFDVIILVIPLPLVWRLNLSLRKKIALTGMFLLGFIVCVSSILRIVISFPINFEDPIYSLTQLSIWSNIEPSIGIIAACLPTLRQFIFRRLPGKTKGSSDNTYDSKSTEPTDVTESQRKSHTAIALGGWNTSTAYSSRVPPGESHAMGYPHHTRTISEQEDLSGASFLDLDPSTPDLRDDGLDSNSILVKKELSVTAT